MKWHSSVRCLPAACSLQLAARSIIVALAQTNPSPPPQTPPAANTPSRQPMWYSHRADEMRASKLIGTRVVNTANETVGDVNEIVLGKDGKVAAVIIGVGGFLGMGEREVAVRFDPQEPRREKESRIDPECHERPSEECPRVALGHRKEVVRTKAEADAHVGLCFVTTHPSLPADQAGAASTAGAAGVLRAARMEARALRPARRPVATMEQMSA